MEPENGWRPVGPSVVFNAPPNWPPAPQGWLPSPTWQPPKSWGPVPAGWDLFLELPPGQTAHSGIPGIRTIAARYADIGYLGEQVEAPRKDRRVLPLLASVKKWLLGTRRRTVLTIIGGFALLSLIISVTASPAAQRNPAIVARTLCPPMVAAEIAERLEVPTEKITGNSKTAGSNSPYVPPRAPIRLSKSQTTILVSEFSGTSIYAEGDYRSADKTYWQFSCIIDTEVATPVVTQVAVSLKQSVNAQPESQGRTG